MTVIEVHPQLRFAAPLHEEPLRNRVAERMLIVIGLADDPYDLSIREHGAVEAPFTAEEVGQERRVTRGSGNAGTCGE